MENLIRQLFAITIPNTERMSEFIKEQYSIAYEQVSRLCGVYNLTKSLYERILRTAGLDESHIQQFVAQTETYGWVSSNPFYNTLIIYILTFMAQNRVDYALLTTKYYSLITMSYLIKKYFGICNSHLLTSALAQMKSTSMCKRGFQFAADKVATDVFKMYNELLTSKVDPYIYFRMIVDIRSRLNQAVKHVAIRYYKLMNQDENEVDQNDLEKIVSSSFEILKLPRIISLIAAVSHTDKTKVENVILTIENDLLYTEFMVRLCNYILNKLTITQIRSSSIGMLLKHVDTARTHEIIDSFYNVTDESEYKIILAIALVMLKYYRG